MKLNWFLSQLKATQPASNFISSQYYFSFTESKGKLSKGFPAESKIFHLYVTYLNEKWSVVWLLSSLETRSLEETIYVKGSIPDSCHKSLFFQFQAL